MSDFERIDATAQRQHGLITRAQLDREGVTERRLRTLAARGILFRCGPGIYRSMGALRSWEQRLLVAVLAGGPDAVASHRSAAALWRLDRFRRNHIDVCVSRGRRRPNDLGRVHESTVLPAHDRSAVAAIPVTTPTRTLIDMGRYVGSARLGSLIDDAVRRDLTSYEEMHRRLAELARPGRNGTATARAALADRPGSATAPDSAFEDAVRRHLRAAGLPEPVMHHRVRCDEIEYVLDLAWPRHLVALECDGFRFHRTPQQLEWDSDRRNQLSLRGWNIQHATWRRLRSDPGRIVADVRRALAARGFEP